MPMFTLPEHNAPPTIKTTHPSSIVRLRLYLSAVQAEVRQPKMAPAELTPFKASRCVSE